MATGDQNDCYNRLKAVMPPWFGDPSQTPIINALLQGIAYALSFVYSLWAYAALQTRIKTATDGWLDMIAGDWFGAFLQRRQGQSDASYRALILAWILRERGTRNGVIKVLQDVTGRTPVVFEPNRPIDAGAYSTLMWGYNRAGGYGTQSLPRNAALVTAFRPLNGSQQFGVQDADIYSAVEAVRPAGTTMWVQLQN
jgi:hypothetical protein